MSELLCELDMCGLLGAVIYIYIYIYIYFNSHLRLISLILEPCFICFYFVQHIYLEQLEVLLNISFSVWINRYVLNMRVST